MSSVLWFSCQMVSCMFVDYTDFDLVDKFSKKKINEQMSKILVGHFKQFPTSFAILPSESDSGMVTSVPICWVVTSVPGPVSVLIVTFPEKKKKVIYYIALYIQSWPKISAPLQFCQKMQPFSQKIVLVLTFIYFFVCIGTTQKKKQKKSQIWYNSTQNPPKNALDKIIGTLNLIFGSTPFGKNNRNQSLPVTMNEFLTPLYWNFGPLFFANCSRLFRFKGCLLPTAVFEISPQVFYGIQIWTHCWPFQNSPALCL